MAKEIPEWLEKKLDAFLENTDIRGVARAVFLAGAREVFQITNEISKPRPIEGAPIEKDILTYGHFCMKDNELGQSKFVVGSFDTKSKFYHENNNVADYRPIYWLPLPEIEEGE